MVALVVVLSVALVLAAVFIRACLAEIARLERVCDAYFLRYEMGERDRTLDASSTRPAGAWGFLRGAFR